MAIQMRKAVCKRSKVTEDEKDRKPELQRQSTLWHILAKAEIVKQIPYAICTHSKKTRRHTDIDNARETHPE